MPLCEPRMNALMRVCARQQHAPPALRTSCLAMQKRYQSEASATSSFDSPFRGASSGRTTKIPSFSEYKSKTGEVGNKVFQYFMVGSFGALAAMGAKATVQGASSCLAVVLPMDIKFR